MMLSAKAPIPGATEAKKKHVQKRIGPDDILTPKEIGDILMAATSLRDKAFLAALWETGVRKSELTALKLKNVKRTGDHYTIWFPVVKITGEEHEGFILEGVRVMELWLAYLKAKGWDGPECWLFPTWRGNRIDTSSAWRIAKRTARRAGITKRVTAHLFRHSRATHLLRIGVSESQVKALLGWKQGSPMLGRYSHLTSRAAKNGLLKALGMEPEKVEVESVSYEDVPAIGKIRPMIRAPPGRAVPGKRMDEYGNPVDLPAGEDYIGPYDTTAPPTPERVRAVTEALMADPSFLEYVAGFLAKDYIFTSRIHVTEKGKEAMAHDPAADLQDAHPV